jgi:hypothetical protein
MTERVYYVDRDELKSLWRVLERLQADVQPGTGYVWNERERAALATVMDAIKDTHEMTDPALLASRRKFLDDLHKE